MLLPPYFSTFDMISHQLLLRKVWLEFGVMGEAGEWFQAGPPRGLGGGGGRANTKSGVPQNGLCEGGLGAYPQEILRFCML